MTSQSPATNRDERSLARCRRCGYDLRGNAQHERCPECGASLENALVVREVAEDGRTRVFPIRLRVPWWAPRLIPIAAAVLLGVAVIVVLIALARKLSSSLA